MCDTHKRHGPDRRTVRQRRCRLEWYRHLYRRGSCLHFHHQAGSRRRDRHRVNYRLRRRSAYRYPGRHEWNRYHRRHRSRHCLDRRQNCITPLRRSKRRGWDVTYVIRLSRTTVQIFIILSTARIASLLLQLCNIVSKTGAIGRAVLRTRIERAPPTPEGRGWHAGVVVSLL
jgi:hypothetical protein